MGHYDCPGCGQFHCVCPEVKTTDDTLGKWMIGSRFVVIKSDDACWPVRLQGRLYATKKEAEQALPIEICKAMDEEEAQHAARMQELGKCLVAADEVMPRSRKGPKIMEPIVLSDRHEEIKAAVLRVKYRKQA
jgi:hypothetical protein